MSLDMGDDKLLLCSGREGHDVCAISHLDFRIEAGVQCLKYIVSAFVTYVLIGQLNIDFYYVKTRDVHAS